jgi:hypothetical protein
MFLSIFSCALFIGFSTSAAIAEAVNEPVASCRNIPGDAGWPAPAAWNLLNTAVGGRLIATNPIAHVCHNPTFSEADCASLTQQWDVPELL